MFPLKRSNSIVNYVHEELFRVTYDDHSISYSERIIKKNLLLISMTSNSHKEMHKFEKALHPPLTDYIFQVRKNTFNCFF